MITKRLMRLSAFLLTVVFSLSVLTACGDDNDEPEGFDFGKPVTYSGVLTVVESSSPAIITYSQDLQITMKSLTSGKVAMYGVNLAGNIVDIVVDDLVAQVQDDLFRTVYNGSATQTLEINGEQVEAKISLSATEYWTGNCTCSVMVTYKSSNYSLTFDGNRK